MLGSGDGHCSPSAFITLSDWKFNVLGTDIEMSGVDNDNQLPTVIL